MIEHKIISSHNGEKTVYSIIVSPPLDELSIISNLHNINEFNDYIKVVEKIVSGRDSNYSELGAIHYQYFLWGCEKSKIIEFIEYNNYIEKAEFSTCEFLELCYKWRDTVLNQNN